MGGDLCIFSLLGAVSLYYRDIFSAAKLTYSFQSVAGGAGSYVAFSHTITWVEKEIYICHEFCVESASFCSCWAEGGAILFGTVDFNLLFFDVLVCL